MFSYPFRWNKGQKCSGGGAPHCGQSSSSSSIFTPGCTRRPCRSTCSSSWWPCSVVGVAVCQILDPPTTLAGKGDRRGHQEAWLQTSSYWVRIWFFPHKVIWSSRQIHTHTPLPYIVNFTIYSLIFIAPFKNRFESSPEAPGRLVFLFLLRMTESSYFVTLVLFMYLTNVLGPYFWKWLSLLGKPARCHFIGSILDIIHDCVVPQQAMRWNCHMYSFPIAPYS